MNSSQGSATVTDLARYFLRLGAIGFGGPAALVERIHRDLVGERGWLTPAEYETGLGIAAACPGPLAFQLAVFCGYARQGVAGALAVAVAFATVPFLLVVAVAAGYERFGRSHALRGIFYGVGPVVVALIVRACWNLGKKTLQREGLAWLLAIVVASICVTTRRELTGLILASGLFGMLVFRPAIGPPISSGPPTRPPSGVGGLPLMAPLALTGPTTSLFLFFFKTGCLVFGSGLVIVPFLQAYVVNEYGWLSDQEFRDAVAVGMVSPGPVVITATFVGYVVDGVRGALAATAGMFSPAVVFTIVAAPFFRRHRANRHLQGFVKGVTTAVVGLLAATAPLVAETAIPDWFTAALAVTSVAILSWRRVPEPLVVVASAVVGMLAY